MEVVRTRDASSLRDYLAVLRRRAWVILVPLVVLPAATLWFSRDEEPVYAASARVFVASQGLADLDLDIIGSSDPARSLATQSELARSYTVAERTIAALEPIPRTADDLLSESSVGPVGESDLLEFHVEDPDPALARRLATQYALEFTRYQTELTTGRIQNQRQRLAQRLRELRRAGRKNSQRYDDLLADYEELTNALILQGKPAQLVQSARRASEIGPQPLRDAVLAAGLALLVGIGVAFLLEALDTRPRSADDIGERLGLPLLARVPRSSRKSRKNRELAMLVDPHGPEAEAYRVLRANVELAAGDAGHQVIMVTSALGGEGKSTVAANLAIATARAGYGVALVDFDLRRPAQGTFFGVNGRGVTDVARGEIELEQALAPIAVPLVGRTKTVAVASPPSTRRPRRGNGSGPAHEGRLEVLPAGPTADAGELFASGLVDELLGPLRGRAQRVFIDAPPLLGMGDAAALSAKVDALIVIVRLERMRDGIMRELQRALARTPATKLGFVLVGVDARDYPYYYGPAGTDTPHGESDEEGVG